VTRETWQEGVLRERWDDAARLFTAFNASGVQSSQRAFTAAENAQADTDVAAAAQITNATDLRTKALAALTANDTFLAIASPTNAQVAAQVKALTRECNALIRLTIGQLDTTTGT